MAVVDADCNFIYVDCGAQGRVSDGGVFKNTKFFTLLERGLLNLPDDAAIENASETLIPYFFIGDDAFPLQRHIMKPYSRRNLTQEEVITNYRFSRARRTSENAFGMLANVFRVFHTPIYLEPGKAARVVRTACVLHIFLRGRNCYSAALQSRADDGISCEMTSVQAQPRNCSQYAKNVREQLKAYFNTTGSVPWQDKQATAF